MRTAISGVGVGVQDLWREYLILGGTIDALEINACFRHSI